MLPAFPKIEKLCGDTERELVDSLMVQRAPILGMIQRHYQYEGDSSVVQRYDNTVGESPLHPVSAEVKISPLPIREFIEEELPKHLRQLADQMAKGASKHIYAEMTKATSESGNVIDGAGQPLSEEMILKSLEKMDHSFDPDGTWNPPTIVAPSVVIEKLKQLEAESPPNNFNEALSKILAKKLDEFRQRETDRVLAG